MTNRWIRRLSLGDSRLLLHDWRGRRNGAVLGELLLRLCHPGLELLLRHGAHLDGHAAVVGAADLVALAVICAGFVGVQPGFDGAARNGVALHAERRDEPA